ncbi:MAG TPA: dTDP-4-dehydrorhamnose reductase [Pirellulales bacterium]|nr:dTDP-4-dehydrorhamnose reductase [Pirellulales bacterium]
MDPGTETKIAVTGSQGQLGSELCRRLGVRAIPLDWPEFDLTKSDDVCETLRDLRPSSVINTAAYTQVDRAEEDSQRCWAVNADGVGCLARVCEELGVPLLQISTDYVFGGDATRSRPYREDDAPAPQGVYARSKLAGEQKASAWGQHIIVRSCGLYGKPGLKTAASNFVDTMLRLARQGKSLRIVADQHCTPTYVPHLATAVLYLLAARHFGTYHVVNGGATTWHEFACETFRLTGLSPAVERITTAQYGAKAPRPPYSVLDTSKYRALGGPVMPDWQSALKEYLGETQGA